MPIGIFSNLDPLSTVRAKINTLINIVDGVAPAVDIDVPATQISGDLPISQTSGDLPSARVSGLGTAALVDTGTSAANVPTIAQADVRYVPAAHIGAGGAAHAAATTSVAGFMSAADKTKLDGVQAGAQVNVETNLSVTYAVSTFTVASSTGTNAAVAAATTSAAGAMSAADKTKLNGIETGAEVNPATTASRTSTSTTTVLQAKGMNDHRLSGDHDDRYARKDVDSDFAGIVTAPRLCTQFVGSAETPSVQLDFDGAGVSGFYGAGGSQIFASVDGVEAARIDPAGTSVSGSLSVVTIEKGDARYPLISEIQANNTINSFAFAAHIGNIVAGSTYAGSTLRLAGARVANRTTFTGTVQSANESQLSFSASALSGTWRALGTAGPDDDNRVNLTLFVRIS